MQQKDHILDEHEIVDGIDELGVLLFGHAKDAYWYGSQLSVEETRALAPTRTPPACRCLPPCSRAWSMRWKTPTKAFWRPTNWTSSRCLEIQTPYLGPVVGVYTDWTPLQRPPGFFPEDIDESDPWQFRNILVR